MKFGRRQSRRSFTFGAIAFLTSNWIARDVELVVDTAEKFLKAIGPNRTIKLKPGAYTLSDLSTYAGGKYAFFEEVHDGKQLVIAGVENLKIIGLGSEPPRLLVQPRYANVLEFRNCQNIAIENIEAGHTPDPGYCVGGVFHFSDSENIQIGDCILFGSGTWGVYAIKVNNLTCRKTVIKECTYQILHLIESSDILFDRCGFYDNKDYGLVSVSKSRKVEFRQCEFRDNVTGTQYGEGTLFDVEESDPIVVRNCRIENNFIQRFASNPGLVRLIETRIENNTFQIE